MNDRLQSTVLVLGATGNVGYGVARAAVDAGATVVLPTRAEERARALREELGSERVHTFVGDVSDPADARRLAAEVSRAHPRIDHVVASLGAWWMGGRLVDQTAAEYERVRAMLLDAHVHAARTLLPLLSSERSSYTLVTGVGALRPMDGASLLTIATGGTLALSRVLRFEHRTGPRVNELRIGTRVERLPRPRVVPAVELGRCVLELMASDVRGAIVPFSHPSTFEVNARVTEE